MTWRNDIKNRINQIRETEIIISDEFPNNDNFSKNNYRKFWITCLFVDISGYTKMCEEKNHKEIGTIIRTFQEGVLDIMIKYELKHIQIQGDGIFGVLPTLFENDENAIKIFDCAMDINGYLMNYWKEKNYRISIAEKEELMIIVGINNNENNVKEVIFAGGAVNTAKKQMVNNQKKCILIDSIFETKNPQIIHGKIPKKSNKDTTYFESYSKGWE